MTRELHVYDHASGMIALLFVSPNGTVEAFAVGGFGRIGEFASVAEAAPGFLNFRTVNFLNLSQSSERPDRQREHSVIVAPP
jgi:hypothetical protein